MAVYIEHYTAKKKEKWGIRVRWSDGKRVNAGMVFTRAEAETIKQRLLQDFVPH